MANSSGNAEGHAHQRRGHSYTPIGVTNEGGSYTPYEGFVQISDMFPSEGGSGYSVIEGGSSTLTAIDVQFVPNPDIARVLFMNPVVIQGVENIVKLASEIARKIAPVSKVKDPSHVHYRDTINYAVIPSNGGSEPPIGILYATDFKAAWIEFGTKPRPQAGFTRFGPYAILRRALQMTHTVTEEYTGPLPDLPSF